MKKILLTLFLILSLPNVAFGAFAIGWNATSTETNWFSPNRINGTDQVPRATYFIATSTTASSTFIGLDATSVCLKGTTTCLTASVPGTGTVNNGSQYQTAFYATAGTAVSGTSTVIIRDEKVGIGTTSPASLLQVSGTRPKFFLSDQDAAANSKHWTVSSQGGDFYIASSTDLYATSTPYFRINQDGTSRIGLATKLTTFPGSSNFAAQQTTSITECVNIGVELSSCAGLGAGVARLLNIRGADTGGGGFGGDLLRFHSTASPNVGVYMSFYDGATGTGRRGRFGYDDGGIISGMYRTDLSLVSDGSLRLGASDALAMTIASTTGNVKVGSGQKAPGYKFTVNDDTFGVDSSGLVYTANGSASAPSYTFTGDSNTGMFGTGSDVLGFTTGGTENGRFNSLGLEVSGGTTRVLSRSSTANTAGGFKAYNDQNSSVRALDILYTGSTYNGGELANVTGEAGMISTTGSFPLYLGASSNADISITASHNVGIGTTSPFAKLSVVSGSSAIAPLSVGTSTTDKPSLVVDEKGHIVISGPSITFNGCGTSPSISGFANDIGGHLLMGGGTVNSCKVDHAVSYGTKHLCKAWMATSTGEVLAVNEAANGDSFTIAASRSIGGKIVSYECKGLQ